VTFAKLPPKRQKQFKHYSLMCVIINSSTDRDVVSGHALKIEFGLLACHSQHSWASVPALQMLWHCSPVAVQGAPGSIFLKQNSLQCHTAVVKLCLCVC
jgi:hypothetical protein